jgi:hypothetical protein
MSLRPPSSGAAEAPRRGAAFAFAAILTAALGLRVFVALASSALHPDEIFQYLEQAHRHAFGYGIAPWEYRYGMRSWLLPLFLSAPMRVGAWVSPGTGLYLLLPKLVVPVLSLGVVLAAFRLGDRLSRTHAWVAMLVAATWYELAYFGGHTLTESAAVAMALPGAALLGGDGTTRRQAALAGLLLGFAAILRFHYLPAIGVFVLMSCARDWRGRWLPVVAGGAAALALGAAVDLAMGQAPFSWIVVNFQQNIVAHRAAGFGVSPPFTYIRALGVQWGLCFAPILLLLLPVYRRYRALLAMAVVNLLVHSAIGHKEYRFVLLTTTILIVLAAIGSVEYLQRLKDRLTAGQARLALPALVFLWLAASLGLVGSGRLASDWHVMEGGSKAMAALRTEADLCGVGMVGVNFWESGGYSYLHRDVPLYVAEPSVDIGAQPKLAELLPAFNAIVVPAEKRADVPADYREIGCYGPERPSTAGAPGRVCSFVRAGGCRPEAAAAQRLDRVMLKQDW